MFEERPNEAIDVPVEDEKSPSSEPRGSPQSTICGKGYWASQIECYCKEDSVASGVLNAHSVWTCNDCGDQGPYREPMPKKFKQEETGEDT
ncbi:hypothetical protein Tco_1548509 [Tanacetum coccineum]